MNEKSNSSILWRQRPIDTLTPEELRLALGEAVSGLLARENSGERIDGFYLGVLAGIAAGTLCTAVLFVLFALA